MHMISGHILPVYKVVGCDTWFVDKSEGFASFLASSMLCVTLLMGLSVESRLGSCCVIFKVGNVYVTIVQSLLV